MKKLMTTCFIVAMFALMGMSTASAYVINPATGWSGYFGWYDLGQMDWIAEEDYTVFAEDEWTMALPAGGTLSFATAYDHLIAGDEFALYIDDVYTPWDMTFTEMGGYFHGMLIAEHLSPGTHSFYMYVTEGGGGFPGDAHAMFSAVCEDCCQVPAPGAILLGSIGVSIVGWLRRRRTL